MHNELLNKRGLLFSAGAGVICSSIVLPFYSLGALILPITDEFGWTRAEFKENVARFMSGRPLLNVVDKPKGY